MFKKVFSTSRKVDCKGQTVAIWGCGPVGLMAVMWSKFKKAGRVIAIDAEPYRLDMAKKLGISCYFGNK